MATILVIDDDEDICNLVALTLEGFGHDVLKASDGPSGLELMTSRLPDLVVLDVMMPDMDGFTVMREMRRIGLRGKTRVIALTAKTRESDVLTGWQLGIDDYVSKPFEPAHLGTRVREVLLASSDELARRRESEVERASILSRVENLFDI